MGETMKSMKKKLKTYAKSQAYLSIYDRHMASVPCDASQVMYLPENSCGIMSRTKHLMLTEKANSRVTTSPVAELT